MAALLVAMCLVSPLAAEKPLERSPSGAVELMDDFWSLVSEVSTKVGLQNPTLKPDRTPQAIPSGGPTVELSNLAQPTAIEHQLLTALPRRGDLRLTIPGGTARQGHYSVGSAENLSGHLLVVDGDADVYGTVRGNLVTMRGNVVLHQGSVVSGDILTLGGEVRDLGGEIGGEVRTLKAAGATGLTSAQAEAVGPVQSTLARVAGVLGVFLTMLVLGFGVVIFGRQNL